MLEFILIFLPEQITICATSSCENANGCVVVLTEMYSLTLNLCSLILLTI